LVKECIRFTSSIAPRHWIVAFRKHVFPVFRSPHSDFVGEGLLLAFCLGSRGSWDGCGFFSANLRTESCLVESYLVPVSCLRIEAWKGVVRPTAGISILEPSVGSRKTCGVGLCLVSFVRCGEVCSIISPLSLLSSYLVRLPGAVAREELCAWSVCRSLHGWLGASMHHAMAWLIFLYAGFVPDFAAGPWSHVASSGQPGLEGGHNQ